MTRSKLPLILFAAAALLFAACAALQYAVGNVLLGIVFTVLTAVNILLVSLMKTGRLSR